MDFISKLFTRKPVPAEPGAIAQPQAPPGTQIVDPSNEAAYVRRCLEVAFEEQQESRNFRSDPAFATVLSPLNAQQYVQAIKTGQAIFASLS